MSFRGKSYFRNSRTAQLLRRELGLPVPFRLFFLAQVPRQPRLWPHPQQFLTNTRAQVAGAANHHILDGADMSGKPFRIKRFAGMG
jgi:hypothetical protein